MIRRKRRSAQQGEFQDPLKDYSTPDYEDELEKVLGEGKVTDIENQPVARISPDTTIEQAMRKMSDLKIACLVVVTDNRMVGLFSERDILNKVVDRYSELKSMPITEVMTTDPVVAYETDSPAKAVGLMAVSSFRHVPIVDVDDKLVGLLGPRRVTSYLRRHSPDPS